MHAMSPRQYMRKLPRLYGAKILKSAAHTSRRAEDVGCGVGA